MRLGTMVCQVADRLSFAPAPGEPLPCCVSGAADAGVAWAQAGLISVDAPKLFCAKALPTKAGANEDRCAIDSDAFRSATSAQIANRGTLMTSIGVRFRRQHDAKITFSSSGVARSQSFRR